MIRFQPSLPASPIPPGCTRSIVSRLAETMREMAFSGHNVNIETLVNQGYPKAVVTRFHVEAANVARRRSVRQIS